MRPFSLAGVHAIQRPLQTAIQRVVRCLPAHIFQILSTNSLTVRILLISIWKPGEGLPCFQIHSTYGDYLHTHLHKTLPHPLASEPCTFQYPYLERAITVGTRFIFLRKTKLTLLTTDVPCRRPRWSDIESAAVPEFCWILKPFTPILKLTSILIGYHPCCVWTIIFR